MRHNNPSECRLDSVFLPNRFNLCETRRNARMCSVYHSATVEWIEFEYELIIYLLNAHACWTHMLALAGGKKRGARISCNLPDEQIIRKWIRHVEGFQCECVYVCLCISMDSPYWFASNLQIMTNSTLNRTWRFRCCFDSIPFEQRAECFIESQNLRAKSQESSFRLIHFQMKSFSKVLHWN